jgi:tRNA 2-thiouridine synthesizing protein A
MSASQVLHVLATDPGSKRDFEVFTQQSGNTLLESAEDNGVFSYLIRKKA